MEFQINVEKTKISYRYMYVLFVSERVLCAIFLFMWEEAIV